MTTYLIKGARVLGGEPTDLLLKDGVVAEMPVVSGASQASTTGGEVVEADGLVALPGLVHEGIPAAVAEVKRPAQRSVPRPGSRAARRLL